MKDLLDKMDHVDQLVLWVELNNKVNKLSTAVSLALVEIQDYEDNKFRHGSISTVINIKKILRGCD